MLHNKYMSKLESIVWSSNDTHATIYWSATSMQLYLDIGNDSEIDTYLTFCVYPDLSEANLFEQFKDVLMNVGYFDERRMAYPELLEKAKTAFAGVLKVRTFSLFVRYS